MHVCMCVTWEVYKQHPPVTRVAGHARVQSGWAPSGPGTFGVSPTEPSPTYCAWNTWEHGYN